MYESMIIDKNNIVQGAVMSPLWLYFFNDQWNQRAGNTYVANSMLYTNSSGQITSTAAPLNGQILIGGTGVAPALGTITPLAGISIANISNGIRIGNSGVLSITGTANQIDVSSPTANVTISIDPSYPGQTSITTLGSITTGTWNATTIQVPHGGTGLSTSPANGQLLIGNGTNYTLQTITGTSGQIDITNGSGSITINIDAGYVGQTSITTLGTITSGTWNATTLAIGYGGTGQTTQQAAFDALSPLTTTGDLIYYSGGHNVRLGVGSTNQVLTVIGGAPSWVSPVATGVTQIVAGTNVTISPVGGTGVVTINASGGGGSFVATVVTNSATYTEATTNGYKISKCNAAGGAIVANLPTAASTTGFVYTVKKIDATANTVTITANGADTIDGAGTAVISTQYTSVTIVSDGTTWSII
jgi:hypothetical protein